MICTLLVTSGCAEKSKKSSQNRAAASTKRKQTQSDAPLPDYEEDYEYSEYDEKKPGMRL